MELGFFENFVLMQLDWDVRLCLSRFGEGLLVGEIIGLNFM